MPLSMQSKSEEQLNDRDAITPVVMFINHLLGSSGGTAFFKQQQLRPEMHPMYETFRLHGALKLKLMQEDELQHADRHADSVLSGERGEH